MKIYVVIANNGWDYEERREWVSAVCSSEESAEKYIQEQPERFERDMDRIDELDSYLDIRELTESEENEREELFERWRYTYGNRPTYRIEEYELLG